MGDHNVSLPSSRQPPTAQLPDLEVVPSSGVESDSEVDVLSTGNVLGNVSKEEPIWDFTMFGNF